MDSTLNSSAATKILECPFSIKWEIEEEKLTALKNSENGCLITKWFDAANIPGVQYFLRIYPNGHNGDTLGKVWTTLSIELGNEKRVKADYKIFIESVDGIYKFNHEFEKFEGYGGTRFTTDEFFDPEKKFFVDGKLNIKCHGTLCVEREVIDVTNKWEEQNFLGKLWKANDYNDFTIVVDSQSIHAHKSILSLRSPVFKTMFNSGMKEAVENKMEIIDFSYETVKIAIELLYDRKISSLTLEEKMNVLKFYDKYDIQDLIDLLETSLAEDISPASVVRIADYSIAMNHVKFQERCTNFMVACLRMDRHIEDFDDLDKEFALIVTKHAFFDIVKT